MNTFVLSLLIQLTGMTDAEPLVLRSMDGEATAAPRSEVGQRSGHQWLLRFYKELSFEGPCLKDFAQNEQGQSLQEKIASASQAYLNLQISDGQALIEQALDQLEHSPPHSKSYELFAEALGIHLLLNLSEQESLDTFQYSMIPLEVRGLLTEDSLLSRLPLRIQMRIRDVNKTKTTSPTSINPASLGDRVWIFGREQRTPISLEDGRFFIHALRGSKLSSFWLHLEQGKTKREDVWSTEVWDLFPSETITAALRASRPPHYAHSHVRVQLKNGSYRDYFLGGSPLLAKNKKVSVTSPGPSPKPFDPFEVEKFDKPNPISLFKSPWFWIISASALGVGSYFLYDSLNQPRVVATP